MEAKKTIYSHLPETIQVPKELIHKKAEVIFIVDESKVDKKKVMLKDLFGMAPDFPAREDQGEYEVREEPLPLYSFDKQNCEQR
jgi:hypothetical protein